MDRNRTDGNRMDVNEILQQVDSFYAENKGEEAEKLMLTAIREAAENQDNEGLLQLLNELLGYYRETSQVENSMRIAEQAISLAEKMGLKDTIPHATTLLNVANAYRAGGKLQESLELFKEVREIYRKRLAPDNMLAASLENNMSLLYQELGDFSQAKQSLLAALKIVEAKEAEFEVAVTYANLANTCLQMGEMEESKQYATLAIGKFEGMGVADFHYGAALSAMGTYYYKNKNFGSARDYFVRARDIMEQNLGRNEYYSRLQENILQCEKMLTSEHSQEEHSTDGKAVLEKCQMIKGMDLCREYYEAYGKPMIEKEFPEYVGKIAVGLVGEGSDCFGYDDEISRDHDWGPDFCMWVTEETYAEIGERLQKAYEELPKEFKGYHRNVSLQGAGRRGVMRIDTFYKKLLPMTSGPITKAVVSEVNITEANIAEVNLVEAIDWTRVSDASLAAAVNGEVFRDDEGIFTGLRQKLMEGYPEPILYRKLAESAARFSQTGQYNYNRCKKRGDALTAQLMLADCVRETMKLKHYLEGKYPPHDKWLRFSLEQLPDGKRLSELLGKLLNGATGVASKTSDAGEAASVHMISAEKMSTNTIIEEIASFLVTELYAKNFISDTDNYLDAHTEELLTKSFLAELDDGEIIEKIVRLEFDAFDKVKNVGGRASCQNDWPTFYVMRKSQYLTWNRAMLLQYYYDFNREYQKGHNLIEEKYGRMMESTAPAEYEQIKQHFPYISPEKQAIIEQIVALQVEWMENFAGEYPRMAQNARSIHSAEDNLYNTSYETYLRGEISTYSDKMLELYGRYVVEYARKNQNVAYDIMGNSARMYGYNSLGAAELGMQ